MAQTEDVFRQETEYFLENAETEQTLLSEDDLINMTHSIIDLNRAGYADFHALRLLTNAQIGAILNHRQEFGDFLNLLELQTINELSMDTIRLLIPFLTLRAGHSNWKDYATGLLKADKQVSMQWSGSNNYGETGAVTTADHTGPPGLFRLRMRSSYNNIHWALNAGKDPGEPWILRENKAGLDYLSGGLFGHFQGRCRVLALGDFRVSEGFGLTNGQGPSAGRSLQAAGFKRRGPGLMPYRSFTGYDAMRGAGGTINLGKVEWTLYMSRKFMDASLQTDSVGEKMVSAVKTIIRSDLHRTVTERSREKSIIQWNTGQSLTYTSPHGVMGLIGGLTAFDHPLVRGQKPYDQKTFTGRRSWKGGLWYDWYHRNINLFGEFCLAQPAAIGFLNGMEISLGKRLDLGILWRYYSPSFPEMNTNAFSAGSRAANERGLFCSLQYKHSGRLQVSCYLDQYQRPWYAYGVDGPGYGLDGSGEIRWTMSKTSHVYARYRYRLNLKNQNAGHFNELQEQYQQVFRLHFESKLQNYMKIKGRLDLNEVNWQGKPATKGYLGFIEFQVKKPIHPWSCNIRCTWFNSPDYENRIYSTQYDVPGYISVRAFYGSGTQLFSMVKCKAGPSLSLMSRFSMTRYPAGKPDGSGLSGTPFTQIEINLQIAAVIP